MRAVCGGVGLRQGAEFAVRKAHFFRFVKV